MRERRIIRTAWLCLLASLILAGCAARNPLNLAEVDSQATPDQVQQDFQSYLGRTVQWGGLIVDRIDKKGRPFLEILAYPLDRGGKPDASRRPIGLYLFNFTGVRDLTDLQPGLLVTAVGKISLPQGGEGGDRSLPFPVLTGDQVYLWSVPYGEARTPIPITPPEFEHGVHF